MKKIFSLLLVVITTPSFGQLPSKLDTIEETTICPYNNICFLHISRDRLFGNDDWFLSTGFIIAPNIILTAAHNIYSPRLSRVNHITIIPGKYYDITPFGSINISGESNCNQSIKTHPKYSFSQKKNKRIKYDFGVIVLPDSLKIESDVIPLCFVLDSTYSLNVGDTLNVSGYPADKEYGFAGDFLTSQYDICRGVHGKSFSHQLDTYTGNSGSPIWVNQNGKKIIVGVHTFGGSATNLDSDNIALLLKWLDLYRLDLP